MSDQPLLFGPPPDDPCHCAACEWQGDGADLAQTADDIGEAECCPKCGETTILDGRRSPERLTLGAAREMVTKSAS